MPKIAYLILTHGLPYQTIDFLWSVWRPEDSYFVHVDRKSPAITGAALGAIAAAYPNIHLAPSDICTWGGYTLVEASLRCLQAALSTDPIWSHAVLVSGAHLPLRRAATLAAMLEPECCYLTFRKTDLSLAKLDPPNFWSGIAQRIIYEYFEVPGIGHMRGPVRNVPLDVDFFWGSQWWVLSRTAAEFICASRHSSTAEFLRGAIIPDESYFQTMLLNSPLKERIKHQQIIWQKWSPHGRPVQLSDEDITNALASTQFFARKAGEATMREADGVVAKTIASVERRAWVESVKEAFARFLSPSMLATVGGAYRKDGDVQVSGISAENEIVTLSVLNQISQMISHTASKWGLNVQISPNAYAVNECILTCRFPDAQTQATYLLILRFCRLEIAWVGIYLQTKDREKAREELKSFPDTQFIDFEFPQAPGFYLHHDLLEYGVRKKGVIRLDVRKAAENLEAVVSEYLEILSKIPGMVKYDKPRKRPAVKTRIRAKRPQRK